MGADEVPSIGADAVVAPSPSAHTFTLDGEVAVFDERNGRLHLLDPPADVVWGALDGRATLAELAAELADAYATEPAQVESDVVGFARTVAANGLLAVAGVADPDPGERPPRPPFLRNPPSP